MKYEFTLKDKNGKPIKVSLSVDAFSFIDALIKFKQTIGIDNLDNYIWEVNIITETKSGN